MQAQEAQALHEKISAYGLMQPLKDRIQILRVGRQPAHSTFYRAFEEGGTTPLLRMILNQAQIIVNEHEATLAEMQAA